MRAELKPGAYVVAVSGGVDSMVLLDLLRQQPSLQLVVAHLDHGIRNDSRLDRQLVEKVTARYGLPFVYQEAHLGSNASEAEARTVRYEFLRTIQERYDAQAIVTAHHQDDLMETAVLNMMRGTGRKGLSSLSLSHVVRPLLNVPKEQIRQYAETNAISWREDSTNFDERYLRNFVRRQIMARMSENQKRQLLKRLSAVARLNNELDVLLADTLDTHLTAEGLNRRWFIGLPYAVSAEVMVAWLRRCQIRNFDRKAINRLVIGAKTAAVGKLTDINAGRQLYIGKHHLQFRDRRAS